jgi:hypothetical protein
MPRDRVDAAKLFPAAVVPIPGRYRGSSGRDEQWQRLWHDTGRQGFSPRGSGARARERSGQDSEAMRLSPVSGFCLCGAMVEAPPCAGDPDVTKGKSGD